MKLWTIQPIHRLVDLQNDKIIHGSWDHVEKIDEDYPDYWIRPYKWMHEQMKERLPACSDNSPIWAWTQRPDLRMYRHIWNEAGWCVRIGFEAPENRFLVSDYEAWHHVLNRFPYTLSEAEWEAWWAKAKGREAELIEGGLERKEAHKQAHSEMDQEMKATWTRIFDLDAPRDTTWLGEDTTYQACVDGVEESWVTEVRSFRPVQT